MGVYAHEKFHESHFCGTYVVVTLWVNYEKSLITRNDFDFKSKQNSLNYILFFILTYVSFLISLLLNYDFLSQWDLQRAFSWAILKIEQVDMWAKKYVITLYALVSKMFPIQSLSLLRH